MNLKNRTLMTFRGFWGYGRGKGTGNYTLTDAHIVADPRKIKMTDALP